MKNLLSDSERTFAKYVVKINEVNPFLPDRVEYERQALGPEFTEEGAEWNLETSDTEALVHPNIVTLVKKSEEFVEMLRARWPKDGRGVSKADAAAYVDVVGFWIYHAYARRFDELIRESEARSNSQAIEGNSQGSAQAVQSGLEKHRMAKAGFYGAFRTDVERLLRLPGLTVLDEQALPHLFAYAFQLRRAFFHIFHGLAGSSPAMVRLRAAIWESIFTHDMARYRRSLYARMNDFATLVIGPSGTGKELVARAVALSSYLPFDPKRGEFADDFSGAFFPLNLSALSPTLIESELFGHRRGAFTGALADRLGWMEVCSATGAVFLDEIGDVSAEIQVKLLRVLQVRTFQRLGDTETRRFHGKIIAATNRDLPAEIRSGRFREDFYYRLCSDVIRTPSLREQLDERPEELEVLAGHVTRRLLGDSEGTTFTKDAVAWMRKNLGERYAWPGNFRELEQCIRNLLVRGAYTPAMLSDAAGPAGKEDWNTVMRGGLLPAEELLTRYTRIVHELAGGNVQETARRLGVDRRTVKGRL